MRAMPCSSTLRTTPTAPRDLFTVGFQGLLRSCPRCAALPRRGLLKDPMRYFLPPEYKKLEEIARPMSISSTGSYFRVGATSRSGTIRARRFGCAPPPLPRATGKPTRQAAVALVRGESIFCRSSDFLGDAAGRWSGHKRGAVGTMILQLTLIQLALPLLAVPPQ